MAKIVSRILSFFPAGGTLPEHVWRKRHRFLVGLTWFHAAIIALTGPVLGYGWELSIEALIEDGTVLHAVGEGLVVAFFAALGGRKGTNRLFQATSIGFGLMSASAILVHLSGGYIELHFHFFVMLAFLALYQDWIPYLLAIVYVAIHHGVVGVLWPEEVFNHSAAINAPWTWGGIHAFFVLWACAGSVLAWRFSETAFAWTKLILNSAGEGVYGVDVDGRATFANRAAERMLGYEAEELVSKSMHEVLHHSRVDGTPYPRDECPINAAFKDGTVHRVTDEVFWRKDGTSFWVEYVSTPIIERGQLTGAVVTFADITERKQAEQMKSDFVSFVTHQLRTPLSGIKWMLELAAQAGDLPEETRSYIADAQAAGERLIRLVNDLLDVSRLERGKLNVVPQEIRLGELTQGVLTELAPLIAEKGHRLSVNGAGEVPPVWVDPQLLQQVILNLTSNAIKYTPPRGEIAIRMSREDATVHWAIQDSGIGVPKEAQDRLFEKFYRAENVFSIETEGTGLGLYLVRLILEQFAGRVWCESEEGKGATFTFTLPLRKGGSSL